MVVAVAMLQGPKAIFVKCKSGLGWLPLRSLQGEELLQHQGQVVQHAEDCFDAAEDEEIIELRQQLDNLTRELHRHRIDYDDAVAQTKKQHEAHVLEVRGLREQLREADDFHQTSVATTEVKLTTTRKKLKQMAKHTAWCEVEVDNLRALVQHSEQMEAEHQQQLDDYKHKVEDAQCSKAAVEAAAMEVANAHLASQQAHAVSETSCNSLSRQLKQALEDCANAEVERDTLQVKAAEFERYKANFFEDQLSDLRSQINLLMKQLADPSVPAVSNVREKAAHRRVEHAELRLSQVEEEYYKCRQVLLGANSLNKHLQTETESLSTLLQQARLQEQYDQERNEALLHKLDAVTSQFSTAEGQLHELNKMLRAAQKETAASQAERDGMATKLAHADSEGVETEAENDILKTEMSLLQSKLELLEQQLLAKNRARIHR